MSGLVIPSLASLPRNIEACIDMAEADTLSFVASHPGGVLFKRVGKGGTAYLWLVQGKWVMFAPPEEEEKPS